jgi:hypothetical protein
MPGIRTNHPNHSLPANDLAVLAQSFYRDLDLHAVVLPRCHLLQQQTFKQQVLRSIFIKNFKPMSINYPPQNLQRKNPDSFED